MDFCIEDVFLDSRRVLKISHCTENSCVALFSNRERLGKQANAGGRKRNWLGMKPENEWVQNWKIACYTSGQLLGTKPELLR